MAKLKSTKIYGNLEVTGNINGNASTATKLQTTRTINGANFDGSANITTSNWGTARNIQIGNTSKSVNGSGNVSWSLGEIGAVPLSNNSAMTIHADSDSSSTSEYLTLKAGHNELKVTSSAGGSTVTKSNTNLTYNGNQVYHAGNPQTTVSGNAGTATKLQNARTINGTNFDGSANITTANWGTARNIQIGNTSKSVNGSGNVSWSLSEIGALPLSGGTLSGKINVSGESTFYNGTYVDPWHGQVCSIKASGHVGIGGSLKVNEKLAFSTFGGGGGLNANVHNLALNSATGNGQMLTAADNRIFVGNPRTPLYIESSSNPIVNVGANQYHLYHTGNKPTPSEIGAAASSHNHNTITTKGTNTINGTANDTTANWGAQGHSVHWYTAPGLIKDQPSQWGYILNIGSGTEVHQLWMTQASGNLAHRGGNGSGWSGSWRTILDSSNFSSYALPLTGGTMTGNINTTHVFPKADDTYLLGNDDNRYSQAYVNGLVGDGYEISKTGRASFSGTVTANGFTVHKNADILPASAGYSDIGSRDKYFGYGYFSFLHCSEDLLVSGNIECDGAIQGTSSYSNQNYGTERALFFDLASGSPGLIFTDLYLLPESGNISLGGKYNRFYSIHLVNSPNISSDRKLKNNIKYIQDDQNVMNLDLNDNEVEKLTLSDFYEFIKNDLKLTSFYYNEKDGIDEENKPENFNFGFIAQDIEDTKVGKKFITGDKDNEEDSLSYNLGSYTTIIAGALQKSISKIENLEEDNKNLKSELDKLKSELDELKALIKNK